MPKKYWDEPPNPPGTLFFIFFLNPGSAPDYTLYMFVCEIDVYPWYVVLAIVCRA